MAIPKRRGHPPKSQATEPEAEPPTLLFRGRPPKRSIPASEPDLEALELKLTQSTKSSRLGDSKKEAEARIESVEHDRDKKKRVLLHNKVVL
jgi:hypothetical protein